ncbi:nuclear transport factor 2 family protein [Bacillus sp. ISL-37]|uniref:nuclear transport factor 2 family protein n=1 Tax=Bacillus sp. ISL-37 TaxID=2819123 RepID=UPI001BECBEB1|nr:nuclear transport factor 2 family protein [Bacillus sp. ISL-37]MBT2682448.1 nuclear transport factor 2 family protein [Bacillus sp. ISL-37]
MEEISAMLAQKQLDAYNKQNLEEFLSVYSENVVIMEFPSNEVTTRGIEEMRARYGKLFKNHPNNHAELLGRMVHGNKVIDHELVTGRENSEPKKAVAIYEIKGEKIVKVWFL